MSYIRSTPVHTCLVLCVLDSLQDNGLLEPGRAAKPSSKNDARRQSLGSILMGKSSSKGPGAWPSWVEE